MDIWKLIAFMLWLKIQTKVIFFYLTSLKPAPLYDMDLISLGTTWRLLCDCAMKIQTRSQPESTSVNEYKTSWRHFCRSVSWRRSQQHIERCSSRISDTVWILSLAIFVHKIVTTTILEPALQCKWDVWHRHVSLMVGYLLSKCSKKIKNKKSQRVACLSCQQLQAAYKTLLAQGRNV